MDKAGVVHYYDEWPEFAFEGAKDGNLTVTDYANLIRSREAGRKVDVRILDRHFGNARRTLGGMTLRQEFAEQGIDFIDSYALPGEEVETGIMKVKEFLRYDTLRPVDSLNRPRVVFSPKCKNLIAAMERWGRDPETGKPMEEYKDFADLVRMDLMSNPIVEEQVYWPNTSGAHYGVGT